jgi:hypothetical protein
MYLRLLVTALAFLVFAAAGWIAVMSIWGAIVDGWHWRTSVPWFDAPMLVLWALASALFVLLGAAFGAFVPSARPILSATVVGAIVGVLIWWTEANTFTDQAPLSAYVWAYGTYALAPIGMALGSALKRRLSADGTAGA